MVRHQSTNRFIRRSLRPTVHCHLRPQTTRHTNGWSKIVSIDWQKFWWTFRPTTWGDWIAKIWYKFAAFPTESDYSIRFTRFKAWPVSLCLSPPMEKVDNECTYSSICLLTSLIASVHNAIYLRNLTQEEFKEKLVEALGITSIPIKNYYLIGPNDIRIKVTDHVVMNMKNESIYSCNLDKGVYQMEVRGHGQPISQGQPCLLSLINELGNWSSTTVLLC